MLPERIQLLIRSHRNVCYQTRHTTHSKPSVKLSELNQLDIYVRCSLCLTAGA